VRGSKVRAGLARDAGASCCARELDGGSRGCSDKVERWSPAAARNLINCSLMFTNSPPFWDEINNLDINIYILLPILYK
jgi:hypothetical protein